MDRDRYLPKLTYTTTTHTIIEHVILRNFEWERVHYTAEDRKEINCCSGRPMLVKCTCTFTATSNQQQQSTRRRNKQ